MNVAKLFLIFVLVASAIANENIQLNNQLNPSDSIPGKVTYIQPPPIRIKGPQQVIIIKQAPQIIPVSANGASFNGASFGQFGTVGRYPPPYPPGRYPPAYARFRSDAYSNGYSLFLFLVIGLSCYFLYF